MRAPFLAFVRGADGSARLEICRYSGCFDPKLCDVYQVSTLMLCQSFFCRFLERLPLTWLFPRNSISHSRGLDVDVLRNSYWGE